MYEYVSLACFRRLNSPYPEYRNNGEYGYQSGINADYSQRSHGHGHHHRHHGHGSGQYYVDNQYGQLDNGYAGGYNRGYGDNTGLGVDHGYGNQYRGHHNHRLNQFGAHNHQ
ncbi:hypothetical protein AAVH_40049 [Aphelenchoides avenae]|nr:hypothetical protein AAVH_40049 [Aphelenchus avenae]